jgi:hypothetical protein
MAREDPTIYMRIPADLKDQLDQQAKSNGRSLTAEVVARLQATLSPIASTEAVSSLALDLAKARRDAAHAAWGRQEKLIQLMLLYDTYRDVVAAADALGLSKIIPKRDRDSADNIGSEADMELARQAETFEPYALFDGYKMTEEEVQAAVRALAEFVARSDPPTAEQTESLHRMRQKIRERRAREHAEGKFIRDPSNEPTRAELAAMKLGRKGSKKPKEL